MPEKQEQPRWSSMEDDHPYLETPPIDGAEYIAEAFHLSGMVSSGGMGMTPLSWLELDAFCRRSVTELTGWESQQVINMSRAYCAMHRKAEKPSCPPPYVSEEQSQLERAREIVAQRFKEMKRMRKENGR